MRKITAFDDEDNEDNDYKDHNNNDHNDVTSDQLARMGGVRKILTRMRMTRTTTRMRMMKLNRMKGFIR